MKIEPTVQNAYYGSFDITDATVLRGQGRDETKIDGNGIDRVLTVYGTGGTVRSLTVTGGDPGSAGLGGGGILAFDGEVTLTNLVITRNEAPVGGGIASSTASALTVTNSTISRTWPHWEAA